MLKQMTVSILSKIVTLRCNLILMEQTISLFMSDINVRITLPSTHYFIKFTSVYGSLSSNIVSEYLLIIKKLFR